MFDAKMSVKFGKRRKNGRKITLSETAYAELTELISNKDIVLQDARHRGVPQLFRRYGRRYGIIVGLLLTAAALMISDEFVWRIEIYGNENVSEKAIEDALSELGFELGTYIKNVDFDVLHNRFLAASEEIAWISVNMHGNVAYAEVREYLASDSDKSDGAANIVAAKDGVVTLVSAFDGKREVAIGESVKKGQLLISGVMEFEGADTRYVYAKGEVYAECERSIHIEVPLTNKVTRKSFSNPLVYGIKFFSKEIFFGGKGRIDTDICDTITVYKDLAVFGGKTLPFSIITVKEIETETVTEVYTEARASAVAYAEYKREFIEKTDGVTLLSYAVESGMNEERTLYFVDCTLSVIENIAETKEFTVND